MPGVASAWKSFLWQKYIFFPFFCREDLLVIRKLLFLFYIFVLVWPQQLGKWNMGFFWGGRSDKSCQVHFCLSCAAMVRTSSTQSRWLRLPHDQWIVHSKYQPGRVWAEGSGRGAENLTEFCARILSRRSCAEYSSQEGKQIPLMHGSFFFHGPSPFFYIGKLNRWLSTINAE